MGNLPIGRQIILSGLVVLPKFPPAYPAIQVFFFKKVDA